MPRKPVKKKLEKGVFLELSKLPLWFYYLLVGIHHKYIFLQVFKINHCNS
jgi:hypothetical protein